MKRQWEELCKQEYPLTKRPRTESVFWRFLLCKASSRDRHVPCKAHEGFTRYGFLPFLNRGSHCWGCNVNPGICTFRYDWRDHKWQEFRNDQSIRKVVFNDPFHLVTIHGLCKTCLQYITSELTLLTPMETCDYFPHMDPNLPVDLKKIVQQYLYGQPEDVCFSCYMYDNCSWLSARRG